jgi:hypothetical protein
LIEQAAPARRVLPVALASNGVELAFDARLFAPMRDSTDLLDAPAALARRFRDDGYVLLRGVLDRADVMALRADYFSRLDPVMLAPGTSPEEGIFSGELPSGLPEYGTPGHPAYELVRSAHFDRFTRDPRLLRVAESVLSGPAELVPRRILRHFTRAQARASRAHVDFDYMGHGSDEAVTAWMPIGDCPIECGGLVYLAGSHHATRAELDGLRVHTDRPGDSRPISNDLGLTAQTLGGKWLWTDFTAGDVVLHSPHMVHASLDDLSDVMRLSVDVRFKLRAAPADERWLTDWSADDGF